MQRNIQGKPLNGPGDIDSIIQERLNARDREHETIKLKEELEETKKQLEEAEEYAEELEKQLEETKSNKFKLGNINIGELASVAIEGIVRRNPQMLAKLPGGEALAGIIEQDTAEKEKRQLHQPANNESEASFKKKTEETLTEDQKRYVGFLSQLEQVFNQEDLEILMKAIQQLSEQPARLKEVTQLLNTENI